MCCWRASGVPTTATPATDAVDPREIDAALIAGLYKRAIALLAANLRSSAQAGTDVARKQWRRG
ncbi:MAG: hypothetical protein LPL00_12485, partial [Alphaproteobacteria bacterium]|nr:hypothetical protein [Alphaproteobacteria bacterium]